MKLWEADQARKDSANVSAFIDDVNQKYGLNIQSFSALYDWGFEKDEDFWNAVWDFSGIIGEKGERIKVADPQIFKGHFFTDGKLNFAENFYKASRWCHSAFGEMKTINNIKTHIRSNMTPPHVPAVIYQVSEI